MSTQPPQVTIPNTEMLSISSSNVEPEFRIFVALPHTYANSGKAYPVLYLLDANAVFGTVTETARFLAILKEIPEIIVVGIGYPIDSFAQSSFEDARLYHQKLLKLYNLMLSHMLVQVKRQIFSNLFANN